MKEYLELPLRNLTRRPKRSIITLLGVIIGVTAIISLTAMGDGLRGSITDEFAKMGSNTVVISPGDKAMSMVGALSGGMTRDDIEKIKSIRGVEKVMDYYMTTARVCQGKTCGTTWIMFADNADVFERSWPIETGRMIENNDRTKTSIGAYVGRDLFDKELRVGDRLNIAGIQVEIVGIAKSIGSPEDDRSIILSNAAKEFFGYKDVISGAMAVTQHSYDPREVAERIKARLEKNSEQEYSVETYGDLVDNMNSILEAVTWVFLGIAGISILVGGIGITNTMYMSIKERTREIGVMKAIGATHEKIRSLIMIEAGLLGVIGGLIGITLGWIIATIASMAAQMQLGIGFFSARISLELVMFALVFSFTVGVISGYLPARAAARLHPVEALRYE